MCPRAEVDEFLPVFHPMSDRHESRDTQIAGDVEHPQAAPGFGELVLQVTDIRIIEIGEPPRHSDLVPLKNPGIPLDRLHERACFALLRGAALAEAAAA